METVTVNFLQRMRIVQLCNSDKQISLSQPLQPPLRRSFAMVALATLLHVTCFDAPLEVRVRTSYDITSTMFYQQ
jgi:hypothetical protein